MKKKVKWLKITEGTLTEVGTLEVSKFTPLKCYEALGAATGVDDDYTPAEGGYAGKPDNKDGVINFCSVDSDANLIFVLL